MKFLTLLTADARHAWDGGARFYTADIADVTLEPTTVVNEGSVIITRNVAWEKALEAITSVGWELHTWTPMAERLSGQFPIKVLTMRALFVRRVAA